MSHLRADRSENREVMTAKMTQKMIESQKKGKKQKLADLAANISAKMALQTGDPGAAKAKELHASEDEEAERRHRMESVGPPGFYDEDLKKYYSKFDKSFEERQEYKERMRHMLSFTNSDWNRNVESQGTSHGQRRSKQVVKMVNGVTQTLR